MKLFYSLILVLIPFSGICQEREIPNIRLFKAKIKSVVQDTTSIGGLTLNTTKYTVQSKTEVATRQTFTGVGNKYKTGKIRIDIYHTIDSTGVIQDSIYKHIENYWDAKEEWLLACPGYKDSAEVRGDFRYLPVNEGFYKMGTDTIPFIETEHGRIGTYLILLFKHNFYKIVLRETEGAGGMGVVGQNIIFHYDEKEYLIDGYVTRWMDEIREVLSEK